MDTKSANRLPTAQSASEGIYIVDPAYHCALICTICERGGLSTSPLVKASHAKKHVREGKVIRREVPSYDGLRSVWEKRA